MQEYFMRRAIELATMGSGFVNPDPLAGAVLVKNKQIIGEAYYEALGSVSAEFRVFQNLSVNPEGAELYLTIEPFCAEEECRKFIKLLQRNRIEKVYLGMLDPNPKKDINMIHELKLASIACEVDILKEECHELNEIYAFYIVHQLPYVIVKWAMTMDGKLATKTGDSKWISSQDSLKFVHHLRQRVSAILVGENTVKMDDPLLTTRLSGIRISNPLRIVISKLGDLPMEAKVLQVNEDVKTLIVASENISSERELSLLQKGVQVVKLRERNNHIDFRDLVKLLGTMEIDSLYIEGGSSILASAFESGIVRKVYAAVAPKIIGGANAYTPVSGNGIERMKDAIELKRVSHDIIGQDVIIKGYME